MLKYFGGFFASDLFANLKRQFRQSVDDLDAFHAQGHDPFDEIDNVPFIADFLAPVVWVVLDRNICTGWQQSRNRRSVRQRDRYRYLIFLPDQANLSTATRC